MSDFDATPEFVDVPTMPVQTVVSNPMTTTNKENTMNPAETTTTTETETTVKTNAMLELIPAGQRVSITEQIPHVKNLTFFSGMALLNGAEGKRGRVISEHGTVMAIIKGILDLSVMGDGYLPVTDEAGLLQLKVSFNGLATAETDIENIGVVNARYTGKFADRIVGLSNVAAPAEGADDLDIAMATGAWYRLAWIGGQIKISKKLVNVDAKADEGDEITHMRKQLYRALGNRALLLSEANDQPIVLRWSWLNAREIAYYVGQFALDTKARFEQKREHVAKQQVYKSDVRTDISLQKIEEKTGTKFVPQSYEIKVRKIDGTTEMVDANTLIGAQYVRFLGSIKLGGVQTITEDNVAFTAESLRKNGASIQIVNK